jgi:hypothetical protein
MTFVGSVHNPKIMLGMLIKVLCGDAIVTRRRLSSEGNVTFEDLMSGASDFDVRTVTIEGLTSVRYLLSGTVRIVTVIAPIWSVGLSWSHDTLHFDERFGSLSGESVSGRLGGGVRRCRAAFLSSAQLSRAGTLDGSAFISNSFLVRDFRSRPHCAVSLFKFRRIKHLVVAAITELVVHRALPFDERI